MELYEFFKGQGAVDFAGTNGCYLYQGRDVQERKNKDLRGQILVLAPSEGIGSADTWLRCRKKLSEFQTLTARATTVSPKLTALRVVKARNAKQPAASGVKIPFDLSNSKPKRNPYSCDTLIKDCAPKTASLQS